MLQNQTGTTGLRNHPLAGVMAGIGFLNFNIPMGCLWGAVSVLLTSVESQLHVGRELSTLAIPAATFSCAMLAPVVGSLASKVSVKLLMLLGALLQLGGYVLLALPHNFTVYLLCYLLLLGPALAGAVVLPGLLATRWYVTDRGRALGIVNTPLLVALMPLVCNWTLQHYGMYGTYRMLAAVSVIPVIANLFIRERPPGVAAAVVRAHGEAAAGGLTMLQLLQRPRYWAIQFAYIANSTTQIIIGAHMVPLVKSWGFTMGMAANLLAMQALVGVIGTFGFGWLADKAGGARVLALLMVDLTILWALLLTHPNYPEAMVLIGLIGMHAGGVIPVAGLTLTQAFGQESFGRAFGLVNLVNLPFSVAAVPVASYLLVRTGSYTLDLIGCAVFLALTVLPAASIMRRAKVLA